MLKRPVKPRTKDLNELLLIKSKRGGVHKLKQLKRVKNKELKELKEEI